MKKESLGTVLVTVLTVPRPLCFCFFLIVFNVTFFPFVQSIVHLLEEKKKTVKKKNKHSLRESKVGATAHPTQLMISGPSKENGSLSSGSDLIL